jgi:hypothetical protein
MHLHGVDVGPVQQGLVRRRVIGLDRVDQLELTQDLAAPGRRRRLDRLSLEVRRGIARRKNGDAAVAVRRQ